MRRVSLLAKAVLLLLTLVVDAAHAVCPSAADYSSSPPQKVTDANGADYFPSDLNTTDQPSFCSRHSGSSPCAAHRVYKPAPGANVYQPLLLFLPGTQMEPRLHDLVLQMGAYAGYRTIGLSYDTRFDPGADDLCPAKPDCAACYGPAREEIITGVPKSGYLKIEEGDSIIPRLRQLLWKLRDDDLRDGRNDDQWDSYLDASLDPSKPKIAWRNIIVAGFSQGAGHAAFIALRFGAKGLVMLDGGYDTCGQEDRVDADWYEPVEAAIPKYFVGHCREEIPCPQSIATPSTLMRLGFPDTLYVIEGRKLLPIAPPRVSMTTQAVVPKDPGGEDSFPPGSGKHCNDHFSMARDGCMPTSAQSGAAAATVPDVYLFPPYLARFCHASPLSISLTGEPQPTDLSGKGSVAVTVGDKNATDRALYGISSRERGDDPCQVTLKIESLMTYFDRPDASTQKCGTGKEPTSTALLANFDDRWGTRAFMTGIQVCMDRQDDKVKGFQLFGQVIDNNGDLFPLPQPPPKQRTNCHHWHQTVASCPAGHLATAAELHFEREDKEKNPRSLTGVRLLCRQLDKEGSGTLP